MFACFSARADSHRRNPRRPIKAGCCHSSLASLIAAIAPLPLVMFRQSCPSLGLTSFEFLDYQAAIRGCFERLLCHGRLTG